MAVCYSYICRLAVVGRISALLVADEAQRQPGSYKEDSYENGFIAHIVPLGLAPQVTELQDLHAQQITCHLLTMYRP